MSEKFITLKEAGELSGYSSDYIGQLIRKGKLSGQQVYSSVAWVTTQEALLEYMEGKQKTKKTHPIKSYFSPINLYRYALYCVILFSGVFSLFLFYVASVSIDARLQALLKNKEITELRALEDDVDYFQFTKYSNNSFN